MDNLKQDQDVRYFIFSWLWTMSVFDGMLDENNRHQYYPTSDLVTGPIFSLVAREHYGRFRISNEVPLKRLFFAELNRG